MRRRDVLPEVTGWAQVQGRPALSYEERFRLDVWYVDRCSFLLNVKILAPPMPLTRPRACLTRGRGTPPSPCSQGCRQAAFEPSDR